MFGLFSRLNGSGRIVIVASGFSNHYWRTARQSSLAAALHTPLPLSVKNGCSGRSTGTSAVPQIADGFVHGGSRQRWARTRHCFGLWVPCGSAAISHVPPLGLACSNPLDYLKCDGHRIVVIHRLDLP